MTQRQIVKNSSRQSRIRNVRRTCRLRASRNGAALLFSLFIIVFMTLMVVNVLDSTTLQLSALRNNIAYNHALLLANAGVHEAAAQLENNPSFLQTITVGAFPADGTYEATLASGPNSTVIVTSRGVSGNITRTIQATLEL